MTVITVPAASAADPDLAGGGHHARQDAAGAQVLDPHHLAPAGVGQGTTGHADLETVPAGHQGHGFAALHQGRRDQVAAGEDLPGAAPAPEGLADGLGRIRQGCSAKPCRARL